VARLIPFADLTVSPWRNGAGRKADVAAGPDWLVGFAWLDRDAPFSDYMGHDRTITLIEGAGFALDFGPTRPELLVQQPCVPSRFDGGWPARCRVLDGPCLVLNAMTARATWKHSVAVSPVPARIESDSMETMFLVVLGGRVSIGDATAGPRDAFAIAEVENVRAEPGSRVALIRIDPIKIPSPPEGTLFEPSRSPRAERRGLRQPG